MKRIIYTAVALIICASVFGIADYMDAKKQGALVNYTDEVSNTEAVVPQKKTEITPTIKEEVITTNTKQEFKMPVKVDKKFAKTKVKKVEYPEIVPELVLTEKTKEPVIEKIEPLDILQVINAADSTIQAEPKRKISMEMFSRGPIRDKKFKKK